MPDINMRYAAFKLIQEAQFLQHFGTLQEVKIALELRIATILDNLVRIEFEAAALCRAAECPDGHACPRCEILHLAQEAIEAAGFEKAAETPAMPSP